MVRNTEPQLRTAYLVPPAAITQAALAALERQLDQLILAQPEALGIDLAGVESIESAGLSWLLSTQQRLAGQTIQFLLLNPTEVFQDILLATRLDHRFKVLQGVQTPGNRGTSPAARAGVGDSTAGEVNDAGA